MKNSKNIGTVRTGLPAAWATGLVWLVGKFGLDLSEDDYANLMLAIPFAIPVFYRIAREVEQKFPAIGRIIFGTSQGPSYSSEK